MKKTLVKFLVIAGAAIGLSSCFQSETTIHLKKDGSGTIVEETRLTGPALQMMRDMGAAFGGGTDQDPLDEMFTDEKAAKRAKSLGEGVEFVKSERVERGGTKGARVTYSFSDINKLRVSTEESMKNATPSLPGDGNDSSEEEASKPITFQFDGKTLTIKLPRPEASETSEVAEVDVEGMPESDSQEMEMAKAMLNDMKMSVKLVIEPGIASTDASHHEGNTITLVEMEMKRALEKPEVFKKLQTIGNDDPDAVMALMKGIEGMKFEVKEEVRVTLK